MAQAAITPTARPTHPALPRALVVLTVVSGFLDAVSYLGLGHVFTANMTGNVVIIGFAAVGTPGFSVVGSLVSLAAFLAGSVCAGRVELFFHGRAQQNWIRTVLTAEAVLLAAATVAAFASAPTDLLIALLALAMGLRNGTVRKLAVPDLTTTVLTLTLTGLASDSSLAGGTNPRMGRRVVSVVAMLAGAAAGAALVNHQGLGWPTLIATVLVAGVAIGYRDRH
ncbi:membrane protein [Streptomyces spiralis]|uniref:Membrane protein n=1 Tax=Streptomyces spiralis TaxID=66376 RepID=A0A918ZX95_9ACTN|nr:YoaK family protein [Streptomyces spiralis]GHE72673.1 membrane protein [Streptomyces spiralis]